MSVVQEPALTDKSNDGNGANGATVSVAATSDPHSIRQK
jgi:hypothetical protein